MFLRPSFLRLLVLLPLIVAMLAAVDRLSRKKLDGYATQNRIAEMTASLDIRRRWIKRIIILICITLLVIASAGPAWNYGFETIRDNGTDIIIAIDVSRSMLATDILPSRLEGAKLSIEDLAKSLNGERIGLVAFSGTSFTQCPLTADYSTFLMYLRDLSTDVIPRGGTDIENAIKTAAASMSQDDGRSKLIILLSDGENHEGNPVQAARDAASAGISIYTVGIGSPEGELIPITDDQGRATYLKDDQGNVVKSSLNEALLKQISATANGDYRHAKQGDFGLLSIYSAYVNGNQGEAGEVGVTKRPIDRYQIFIAAVILLVSIELIISERGDAGWFAKRFLSQGRS